MQRIPWKLKSAQVLNLTINVSTKVVFTLTKKIKNKNTFTNF